MDNDIDVFIDPSPVCTSSIRCLDSKEMMEERSGAVVPIAIVTCGAKFGTVTIVTTGTAIISIAE